jgi:hypothetical protein
MSIRHVHLKSLSLLSPVYSDTFTTLSSLFKTGLGLAAVGAAMLLETYVTLKLGDKVSSLTNHTSSPHTLTFLQPYLRCSTLHLSVYAWQLFSYILSPTLLRLDGRAWPDRDSLKALAVWDAASPIERLPVGAYQGGQALAWGLAGKIFFAPCMWKMALAKL